MKTFALPCTGLSLRSFSFEVSLATAIGMLFVNMMDEIDRAFLSVFARHRRKYPASKVEVIWQKATYEFSGFIVFPCAAIAIFLLMTIHALVAWGFPLSDLLDRDIKWIGMIGAALFVLYLDRRYRKYLLDPPPLSSSESPQEAKRILTLRIGGPALFLTSVILAYVLHRAGATT